MDIVKIVFSGILTAVVYSLVKQFKPEFAPFAAIAGLAVIAFPLLSRITSVFGEAEEIVYSAGIGDDNLRTLIKASVICCVSRIGADICNDNSCTAAGDALELSGKLGALICALPMIKTAASFAAGLLNG